VEHEPAGQASDISGRDEHFGFVPIDRVDRHVLAAGARCGGCTVVRLLAEGGMGLVYEAVQDAPRRTVALKVMRQGFASRDLAARFAREAELLARLSHPAVAQVYTAGLDLTADGDRPFIVMELVAGALSLTTHAATHRLDARQRVAVFAGACAGVAHAHRLGIIHRDIKPANLLVDDTGRPKVIDFGVGRTLAGEPERLTTATQQGELLGTIRYMSPEQLGIGAAEIAPASDVYALGLVLHEMLLGGLPYELRGRSPVEAACMLAAHDGVAAGPLAYRLAGAGLPADAAASLAAIIATCLEPSANDRYADAMELETDLNRWLAGEPVKARPPSGLASLVRLARRHRPATIAVGVVLLSLLATIAGISFAWRRAERQRLVAERAELAAEARGEDARRQLYFSTVLLAAEARDRGNLGEARRLLAEATASAAERGNVPVEIDCLTASLDGSVASLAGLGGTVSAVAWSPDGRTAALGTMTGRLRTWRPATPAIAGVDRAAHEAAIWDIAYSPDGRWLATASADGSVTIREPSDGGLVHTLLQDGEAAYGVSFSPSGALVAASSRDRGIRLWRTSTWEELLPRYGHDGTVYSVRFSPGGDRLASASQDGTVRVWSVADPAAAPLALSVAGRVFRATFSPDGRRIAAAAESGSVTIWDAEHGRPIATLAHPTRANAVVFTGDGGRVVTASGDGLLRCWDVATAAEVARLRGHDAAIWSLACSPTDTAQVVTGSADGSSRVWRVDGSADPVLQLSAPAQAMTLTADGTRLAVGDAAGRLQLIDPRGLRTLAACDTAAGRIADVAFAPDGDVICAAGDDGCVHRWRTSDTRPLPPIPIHTRRVYSVVFSPDGHTLATGSEDRTARLVDAQSGATRGPPLKHPARVFAAAFHPDGMRLVTACGDRLTRIWNLADGRELRVLAGHDGPVNWVAFSPAGDRLATASSDGTVRVWSVSDGTSLVRLSGPARQVWRVAFSPDGGRIAATVADGTVQLWDVTSGRPVSVLTGHRDEAWGLAFLPAGHGLATVSQDATVRMWGVSTAALARARNRAD